LRLAFKQITPRLEDAALDVWGVMLGNMLCCIWKARR